MDTTDGPGSASTEAKRTSLRKDKIYVATAIGGLAVVLLAGYGRLAYNTPSDPLFSVIIWLEIILVPMILMWRSQQLSAKLQPPSYGGLRAIWGQTTGTVKHANSWYFLSVLLGLIGGLAGFLAVRDRDSTLAQRLLILGIPATLVYVTLLSMITLPGPKSIPPLP
jgi:hypothetical protein